MTVSSSPRSRRREAARRTRGARTVASTLLLALLAACGTMHPPTPGPGNVSRLPPGDAQRDGPEANPPANLDAIPDAVPQIEPLRVGGPNKPYEIDGHTYVPLTDDRSISEKGLASWYGKKFHGHRTASGEAYNMYAMTAAHKTLPIPSYVRVRNPRNGREVILRVNDRGPFTPGRVIDLSYTAAMKLGVLAGVAAVEIERITDDDIRTGAAFRHGPNYAMAPAPPTAAMHPTTVAIGDLERGSISPFSNAGNPGASTVRTPSPRARRAAAQAAQGASASNPVVQPVGSPQILPPGSTDVVARAADTPPASTTGAGRTPGAAGAALGGAGAIAAGSVLSGVDLGSAAALDAVTSASSPGAGIDGVTDPTVTTAAMPASSPVATAASAATATGSAAAPGVGASSLAPPPGVVLPPPPAAAVPSALRAGSEVVVAAAVAPPVSPAAVAPALPQSRDEHARADTLAGAGFWVQLGAYKDRNGALDFQHRLVDEQPWLGPLLAVFSDRGLNKLQAGPYTSRDDAKNVAERIRTALQLVPTIVEKR